MIKLLVSTHASPKNKTNVNIFNISGRKFTVPTINRWPSRRCHTRWRLSSLPLGIGRKGKWELTALQPCITIALRLEHFLVADFGWNFGHLRQQNNVC